MHCADSDNILVVIYIFGRDFEILRLEKDNKFIKTTIRKLEKTYVKYFYDINSNTLKVPMTDYNIEDEPDSCTQLKPTHINSKSKKRSLSYSDITQHFIKQIKVDDWLRGIYRNVVEYEAKLTIGEYLVGTPQLLSEPVKKQKRHS